jgi:tetratricopeptide (TPR) repeat protein
VGKPGLEALPKSTGLSFGELLEWHLLNGTRPYGSSEQGRAWGKKVFAGKIGISDRQLANWLKNKHLPEGIEAIEDAFFGKNQEHARASRLELREAHRRVKFGSASNITIGLPPHFMGRDEEFALIETALARREGRLATTALHGLRGVGKTALAIVYADRHRGAFRATWWIRAQTQSSMRADLVALGVRLGWVRADDKEEPALAAVMERLRHEGENILLVYDNAIDANSIKPYLPRGGAARVLVTSNAHAWRGVAEPIEIHVWPKKIGVDYLLARTGRAHERAVSKLSEALDGLPLALEQAAAYCERLGVSFAEYHKRFEATPDLLLDDKRHAPIEYHDGRTVAKTFALAIQEAAKLQPAAEQLIFYAALLPPEPIPLFLFSEAREKLAEPLSTELAGAGLDEAVAALRTFALIYREAITDEREASITTDAIRLHRLVRQFASVRCRGEARELARSRLIEALAAVYPKFVWRDPSAWPRTRRLDPLALALVGESAIAVADIEKLAADLLMWGGQYRQYALAAYADARSLFERALAIREKLFGPEHPETATSLNSLAGVVQSQGDLAVARALYERALGIRENVLGPEDSDTAMSLNNLADVVREQGESKVAQPLYERAFAIWQKLHGPEHPETATCLRNVARVLQDQGYLAEAQSLYERVLTIREKILGPMQPATATSLENLASVLHAQGRFAAARPLFERALAIQQAVLGPEHPRTTMCLSNFGDLLCDLGETKQAGLFLRRAVVVGKKTLGVEHRQTQRYQCQYARWLLTANRASEALPLGAVALDTHARVNGPSHPWTKDSAAVTADALDALGQRDEASALRERYDVNERRWRPSDSKA